MFSTTTERHTESNVNWMKERGPLRFAASLKVFTPWSLPSRPTWSSLPTCSFCNAEPQPYKIPDMSIPSCVLSPWLHTCYPPIWKIPSALVFNWHLWLFIFIIHWCVHLLHLADILKFHSPCLTQLCFFVPCPGSASQQGLRQYF